MLVSAPFSLHALGQSLGMGVPLVYLGLLLALMVGLTLWLRPSFKVNASTARLMIWGWSMILAPFLVGFAAIGIASIGSVWIVDGGIGHPFCSRKWRFGSAEVELAPGKRARLDGGCDQYVVNRSSTWFLVQESRRGAAESERELRRGDVIPPGMSRGCVAQLDEFGEPERSRLDAGTASAARVRLRPMRQEEIRMFADWVREQARTALAKGEPLGAMLRQELSAVEQRAGHIEAAVEMGSDPHP